MRPWMRYASALALAVCLLPACSGDDGGGPVVNNNDANNDTTNGMTGGACDDGTQNGDETDVDCGGSCTPCALGGSCSAATDCAAGECSGGVCACVGELGKDLGIVPSTVSHHIKELRQAGLIRMQRNGQNIECSVDRSALNDLACFLKAKGQKNK